MSDYFFESKKITQRQVEQIIAEADFTPTDYTYQPFVDGDGWLVVDATNTHPMAESRLRNAAKKLNITVAIRAGAGALSATANDETVYTIDFDNETPDTWTFAVYQTLPTSPGLDSVSWKQTKVPTSGSSGVQWSINYLVGIANYRQIGGKGVYTSSQKLGTELGMQWRAVLKDDVQQLVSDGTTAKGQVLIKNQSTLLANLAIGMDGDLALVQGKVPSGADAQFMVAPTYWVALFNNLQKGEVISGNTVIGPLKVTFPSGKTALNYRAYIDGEKIVFTDDMGNLSTASMTQVKSRILELERA